MRASSALSPATSCITTFASRGFYPAFAVGAFGFVVDNAGASGDFGDEVEGPRVPHGIVPDGYFGGEGLGAEGVPPFVEPVCVGLFSVADEVFAAGFNVVGFAHGA